MKAHITFGPSFEVTVEAADATRLATFMWMFLDREGYTPDEYETTAVIYALSEACPLDEAYVIDDAVKAFSEEFLDVQ